MNAISQASEVGFPAVLAVSPRRWEHGSEFHWFGSHPASDRSEHPWAERGQFFGSGRDAFRILVEHGRRQLGWRRIWIPTYVCLELVEAVCSTGLETLAYPDGPGDELTVSVASGFAPGDVLLLVNHLGVRTGPAMESLDRSVVTVIEDHTHDPWSGWAARSQADFAIASLRKTLPLPDGAVLWSPRGRVVPPAPPVSKLRRRASQDKRHGMLLKSQYLEGRDVSKDEFRALLLVGERDLTLGEPSGMTPESRALLDRFPVLAWRTTRYNNHRLLAARFAGVSGIRVLGCPSPDGCPFSTVLVFDTPERCQFVCRRLIDENVYPGVIWPLDDACWTDIPPRHRNLSRCILSLHCDMRYGQADLERVATTVLAANCRYADRRKTVKS